MWALVLTPALGIQCTLPSLVLWYGALWYGDDEHAKYFRANTRLFNSRYAFSSLEATRERHPGKPKFQLKGTV